MHANTRVNSALAAAPEAVTKNLSEKYAQGAKYVHDTPAGTIAYDVGYQTAYHSPDIVAAIATDGLSAGGAAAGGSMRILATKGESWALERVATRELASGTIDEAAAAARGADISAVGVGRGSVPNSELTIAANGANGNPAAIARGLGDLNTRQAAVLDQLPEFGSSTIVSKVFGQQDLSALTAATGDEFAMFSTGGRRLIFRGDAGSVPITPDTASELASQGWRWSSHTHPGFEVGVLRSSPGDQALLRAMGGNQSAIFNSMGQRGMFTPNGDSLNGWKPW